MVIMTTKKAQPNNHDNDDTLTESSSNEKTEMAGKEQLLVPEVFSTPPKNQRLAEADRRCQSESKLYEKENSKDHDNDHNKKRMLIPQTERKWKRRKTDHALAQTTHRRSPRRGQNKTDIQSNNIATITITSTMNPENPIQDNLTAIIEQRYQRHDDDDKLNHSNDDKITTSSCNCNQNDIDMEPKNLLCTTNHIITDNMDEILETTNIEKEDNNIPITMNKINGSTTITTTTTTAVAAAAVPTIEYIQKTMNSLFCHPSSPASTIVWHNSSTTRITQEEWYQLIIQRPCVSARIFACFVFWLESQYPEANDHLMSQILPLLLALVRVEAMSVEESDSVTSLHRTEPIVKDQRKRQKTPLKTKKVVEYQPDSNKSKKAVHFLSVDGSSIRPPIDRDLQSGERQQKCIEAMIDAKMVMDEYYSVDQPSLMEGRTNVQALQNLIQFLQTNCNNDDLIQQCASSISIGCSPKLIATTIKLIQQDVAVLLERIENCGAVQPFLDTKSDTINTNLIKVEHKNVPLLLELRLSDLLGQAIRYKLRVLFNPSPPRLSNLDTNYEYRSMTYSKVLQLVIMNKRTKDEDHGGTAVDDGFISALISRALRRLYEYYGLDHIISESDDTSLGFLTVIPSKFCTSEASNRYISPRIRSTNIADEITAIDRDHVLSDIHDAAAFLSATYAARFLLDLFTISSVQEEVQRMGGWSDIERYASISWKYGLFESCPADAHLVPLQNYQLLLRRLKIICDHMEPITQDCIEALKMVDNNYHITPSTSPRSKTTPKRKLHQYMIEIRDTYNEMMMEADAFPQISEQTPIDVC